MSELMHYIKLRSGRNSGCNSFPQFECDKYLDCDSCLEAKIQEHDKQIRADTIDEYMNKLCDKCIQAPNECWNLECPFADDECQIIKIAEQLEENL